MKTILALATAAAVLAAAGVLERVPRPGGAPAGAAHAAARLDAAREARLAAELERPDRDAVEI
jgi:hypothetical protein